MLTICTRVPTYTYLHYTHVIICCTQLFTTWLIDGFIIIIIIRVIIIISITSWVYLPIPHRKLIRGLNLDVSTYILYYIHIRARKLQDYHAGLVYIYLILYYLYNIPHNNIIFGNPSPTAPATALPRPKKYIKTICYTQSAPLPPPKLPIKRRQPSLIVTIGWVHDISHFIITVSTLHRSPFFTPPPAHIHTRRIHYSRAPVPLYVYHAVYFYEFQPLYIV